MIFNHLKFVVFKGRLRSEPLSYTVSGIYFLKADEKNVGILVKLR